MATLEVCHSSLPTGNTERIKMVAVDISQTVRDFKKRISDKIGKTNSDIYLVYSGVCLEDQEILSSVGIKNGSAIYVFNTQSRKDSDSIMDASIEVAVLSALKSTLTKPANKIIITNILKDAANLDNIMEASPGLADDPIALGLLRDPTLMATICKPGNIKRIVKDHPSFGHACLYLASEVTAHIEQFGQKRYSSHALDDMSDDDDDDGPMQNLPQGESPMPLTATELSAALASVQGLTPPAPQSASPANSPRRSGSRRVVTSSVLQDAMRRAQSTSSTPTSSRSASSLTLETQLAQLRDMGITDDVVARQALQATGGDIQAAVELIFGGHFGDS